VLINVLSRDWFSIFWCLANYIHNGFFIAEVGKGNVNWFNEASRQLVKHDTGNNSQATDTDIRLSQKTKASSQQHEQFRHDLLTKTYVTQFSSELIIYQNFFLTINNFL
jgi:hypothetical protein